MDKQEGAEGSGIGAVADRLPRHLAIIMDGNGRWAKQRGLPRHAGHRAGVKAVRACVERAIERGIEVLTLFAFSSENWQRPQKEVGLLMELFMAALQRDVKRLHQNNVRLCFIGDRMAFPEKLQRHIDAAEQRTRDNTGLILQIAANYGGRWDIAQAARRLAEQVRDGTLQPEEISEQRLGAQLSFAGLPDPDLFIRTGGELRISNFLLWQMAYCELYFSELLWPDFDAEALDQALSAFAQRERRFGRTSEQVESPPELESVSP